MENKKRNMMNKSNNVIYLGNPLASIEEAKKKLKEMPKEDFVNLVKAIAGDMQKRGNNERANFVRIWRHDANAKNELSSSGSNRGLFTF